MKKSCFAATLAVCSLLASTAAADPVRVVTSGFYGVSWGEESFLQLSGTGFDIQGGAATREMPLFRCHPCAAGDSIDLSATFTGDWFNVVTATIDGTSYGQVYLSGEMRFMSGSVIVPDLPTRSSFNEPASTATVTGPFVFSAQLFAFPTEEADGMPLFSAALRGQGTASIFFFNDLVPGIHADDVLYTFQASDPVPEPATMTLLSLGLAGVAASRRRRSNR